MKKTLLVITTANQSYYTEICLNSISFKERRLVDIMIIDDASTDDTKEKFLNKVDYFISKTKSKGLTDSWNHGYNFFKKNLKYDKIIISNNDVIYPTGSLVSIINNLNNFMVVGPLSNSKGVEYYPDQDINSYFNLKIDDNLPENCQNIQNFISNYQLPEPFKNCTSLNGYIFGLNREIIKYEYKDGVLFNPKNVNVGNEDELWERISTPKVIDCKSFIFHFKGVSFNNHKLKDNSLLDRNLNWEEVSRYNSNFWYRNILKLKYKIKEFLD